MTDTALDIVIMLDDPELVRLVASWTKLTEQQRNDSDAISAIANIPRSRVDTIATRARAHNLIKDDGTINEFAGKYLTSLVGERLRKTTKGAK